MAMRFSDLDALTGGLSNDDLFAITKKSDNKSYKATGTDLKNFISASNNAGYAGVVTDKTFDELANSAYVGIWLYDKSGPQASPETIVDIYGSSATITQAIVRVSTYVQAPETNVMLLQEVFAGNGMFSRIISAGNTASSLWRRLDNRANMIMDTGIKAQAKDGDQIEFTQLFSSPPNVMLQCGNTTSSTNVYIAEVAEVSTTGFKVIIHKSNKLSVVVKLIIKEE